MTQYKNRQWFLWKGGSVQIFWNKHKEQNSIQEKIKNRLKSGNVCYHSVQNLLYSSLLSKNIKNEIYRTTILRVVSHGCEIWSLTVREQRRFRVFENIIRVIKYRRMRWARHVTRMGERRYVHRIVVEKLEGKRSRGISRRRWEGNIKMEIQKVGCDGVDCIDLAQNRDRRRAPVNAVTKLRVP